MTASPAPAQRAYDKAGEMAGARWVDDDGAHWAVVDGKVAKV